MCTTVNGRYIIMHDNVFDLQENTNIGNLWDSIDVFKTIFNNTDIENDEYKIVKENINKRPLLESQNNLHELKEILLEFNFFQDTWLGRELKGSGEAITDTLTQSWEGIKKFGVSISKNGWAQILNDIGKGVKFVFRRLKSALYSNIGITVDAILVATGVGKSVQWVPWAMVLGLDLYQISKNDWETPMTPMEQWMEILFSSMGLLFAGGVAKGLRATLKPLTKDPKKLKQAITNNKKLTDVLTQLRSKLPSIDGLLAKVQEMFSTKFKPGVDFMVSARKYLSNIMNNLNKFIDSLIGTSKTSKGIKAGAVTSGIMYGLDGGSSQLTPIQIQNLNTLQSIQNEMGDLFDY